MNKLMLCIQADGVWVPVSAENPLPITSGLPASLDVAGEAASLTPAAPVEDLAPTATAAQTRAAFNNLLAALREAGLMASDAPEPDPDPEPDSEPEPAAPDTDSTPDEQSD